MGVYIPYLRLPSEYQEVEYIQSSGTQWIDTLHQHTANSKVGIKFSYQSMSTRYNLLFGSRSRYNVNDAFSIFIENSSTISLTIGGKIISPASTSANTIYNISFSKDYFIINGATTTLNSSLTSYGYNDLLFNFMENGQSISGCNPISAKVYYCRIYEGSTLVRDLVPCYRKSDTVIGMYDLVNNQFYTNSGTGTFSKGNDVIMSELKNAYIGEVYEYSYDFRNKSSTTLTNDGWTVWSGTLGFTSNGIYASSGTVRMKKGGINLTNANKLTMKLNGYFGTGEYGFRVAKITSSNQLSNYSGMYFNVGSQKSLSVNSSEFSQSGLTAGFYSPIAVFDFVNKTSKLSVNGYSDITHSLTDAEISAIKANTDNIFIYLINNNSSSYFQDISLLVE